MAVLKGVIKGRLSDEDLQLLPRLRAREWANNARVGGYSRVEAEENSARMDDFQGEVVKRFGLSDHLKWTISSVSGLVIEYDEEYVP